MKLKNEINSALTPLERAQVEMALDGLVRQSLPEMDRYRLTQLCNALCDKPAVDLAP